MIKKISENSDVEHQVLNQLDKSSKMDEVDTVTFGLETDDNKIVKVYVNADQANDFEKALSGKLGEVDDIETAINDLSKDFEIVDVEWPGDNEEESDDEDADESGSDSLNSDVYDNKNEKSAKKTSVKPKFEGRKTTFKSQLTESPHHHHKLSSSVESRMSTPAQMLIYHALIELGIPEIALDKSPYKTAIVNGIKSRASELNRYTTLKMALKVFIRRAHGLDMDEDDHHIKESVEDLILESVLEDFWDCVTKVIKYLASDEKHATDFLNTTKFKTLVSRSRQQIPKVITSDFRMKIQKLSDAMDANEASVAASQKPGINESVTPQKMSDLFTNLFMLVDPTPLKSVSKTLLNSPEFKAYYMSCKPTFPEKFSGLLTQKLNDVCKLAYELNVSNQNTLTPNVNSPTSTVGSQPAVSKPNATSPVTESKYVLKEAIEWSTEMDGDNVKVSTDGLDFSLDPEEFEKAVKAINSRSVIVVHDADNAKNKYSLSPRGIYLSIKKVGDNTAYQMNADQVQDLVSLINDTDEDEDKDDKSDDDKKAKEK